MAQAETVSLNDLTSLFAVKNEVRPEGRVLLYFWASWCSDCKEKLKQLPALQKEFPGIQVLTVNGDRDAEKGRAFAESESVALPVYRDESKNLVKVLKLFGVPAWALLEKEAAGWAVRKSSVGVDLGEVRQELGR